jgi:hypothetical protein
MVGTVKVALAGLALAAGLTGCSAGDGDRPDIVAPPSADPGASAAAAARAEAATDVNAYLNELKAVDPKLTADKEHAVDNGKNVCQEVEQGKTDAELTTNAAARFDIDKAAAAKVVAATRKTLCPSK